MDVNSAAFALILYFFIKTIFRTQNKLKGALLMKTAIKKKKKKKI